MTNHVKKNAIRGKECVNELKNDFFSKSSRRMNRSISHRRYDLETCDTRFISEVKFIVNV